MQSLTLLQDLCKLPVATPSERKSFKDLVAELVFSGLDLRSADRNRLLKALAEIECLTNLGAPCEVVQGADDVVGVILTDSTIDDRATRSKLRIAQALKPTVDIASLIANTTVGIAYPPAGIVSQIVSFILKRSKAKNLPDRTLASVKTKLVLDYAGLRWPHAGGRVLFQEQAAH